MTIPGRPSGPGRSDGARSDGFGADAGWAGPGADPGRADAGGPDAERVLAQALRAMAGGGKQARSADNPSDVGGTGTGIHLNRIQVLLIAVIAGLLVGVTVGLISLLT